MHFIWTTHHHYWSHATRARSMWWWRRISSTTSRESPEVVSGFFSTQERDFTTKGEIWDIKCWSAELNHDLEELWNNPSSAPTGYHINPAEEAQAMFFALDLPQEGLLNPADNAEEKCSTRYAEPTAEIAQKDLVATAVAETVLNPIASATTKGSEEQLLTKSAPTKRFGQKNGPSDDRTLTTASTPFSSKGKIQDKYRHRATCSSG